MNPQSPTPVESARASEKHPEHTAGNSERAEWLDLVARQVSSLRYGTVQIVVHEGRVTQVESTEKIRLAGD